MSYLKVSAVAAQLGVSEQAVRLWCRTGVLPADRPAGTRQWLVDPERFEAWLRSHATEEVLDSLHAPYRDGRPDHELLADSVALRRAELAAPHEAAAS
jgi:excisionase family DNA binding protein